MQTPTVVLNKLLCVNCNGHLSRAPIHLTRRGEYLCGRCLPTEEDTTRIIAYEDLAKLHNFPCTYKENGCKSSYPFEKLGTHEETCICRKYKCPIVDTCNWEGFVGAIVDHCSENHETHVVHSPFTHKIADIPSGKYLFKNYQDILIMEVCKIDECVSYWVRLIGDTRNITKYEYIFMTENGKNNIRTHQKVAPYGNPRQFAGKSITVKFDTLKDLVGEIKDITAQLIIQNVQEDMTISPTEEHSNGIEMMMPQVTVLCVQCNKMTAPEYGGGWICKDHLSKPRFCKYGCGYEDIHVKCIKHEAVHCKNITRCWVCEKDLDMPLAEHYNKEHDGTISVTNVARSHITVGNKWQAVVNNSIHGYVIYGYRLTGQCFMLCIRFPLPSKQLYMYKCVVDIIHPDTGRTFTYTAQSTYNMEDDWILCIPSPEFHAFIYDNQFDLKINITNIADL